LWPAQIPSFVHGALVYPDHWLYAFGKTEERPPLARIALAIYSLLFYLLTPLILLRLLWRGQKAPEYRQRWAERFGFVPTIEAGRQVIWVHSVSVGETLAAVPMILLLVSTCWHLRLGLQVFIEDYVHEASGKLPLLILLNFYAIGAAALGTFAVLKLAFTGAAA